MKVGLFTRSFGSGVLLSLLLIFGAVLALHAAEHSADSPSYQKPPAALAALVDAPSTPDALVSPDYQWLMVLERPNQPKIAELAQPELRLAGFRINPRNHGPSRPRGVAASITLIHLKDKTERIVTGMREGLILAPNWSPDGSNLAFVLAEDDGLSLWVAPAGTGIARDLTGKLLNGVRGRDYFSWVGDGKRLVCKLVPDPMTPPPAEPRVPAGPVIQETTGKEAPNRTYQDLLKSPFDESVFAYHLASQVALVSLDGDIKRLNEPALISSVTPAPGGAYLLLETIHRPFSYIVPASRFPGTVEVWDMAGNRVRTVANLPLAENIPKGFGAVRTGPRSVDWRSDREATLVWTETQDGGDPSKEVATREILYTLAAPFKGEPGTLTKLGLRFAEVLWGNGEVALVQEWWWKTRQTRTWVIAPDHPDREPRLLHERSFQDQYSDPGSPLTRITANGAEVLLLLDGGKSLLLAGEGATPEGDKPFLDRMDLENGKTTRLWLCQAPYFERVRQVLDAKGENVLTLRESQTDPPNYHARSIKTGSLAALTKFTDPTPEYAGVQKELISYRRQDGVQLTATLYLPAGYTPEQGPLPLLMWAYPVEFKDADNAGQVTDSPYRFSRISFWGPLPFLAMGYAVCGSRFCARCNLPLSS